MNTISLRFTLSMKMSDLHAAGEITALRDHRSTENDQDTE